MSEELDLFLEIFHVERLHCMYVNSNDEISDRLEIAKREERNLMKTIDWSIDQTSRCSHNVMSTRQRVLPMFLLYWLKSLSKKITIVD